MNDEILAIDPGREKTGIAILKNSDVLEHKIINSEELVQIIKSLLEKYIIKTIVMGNGTSSKKKYDLLKHPNIKQTLDGGREPYIHGQAHHFIDDWQNILLSDNEYELLDQEEAEKYAKEIKENEESKNN